MVPSPEVKARYKAYYVQFYNVVYGTNYTIEHEFTVEERSRSTPEDILSFFRYKCYGNMQPVNDTPIQVRNSTLEQIKKSISSFVVNNHIQWNEETNHGNPTRSPLVTVFMNSLKKLEVRGSAVTSKAKRPMEVNELEGIIRYIRSPSANETIRTLVIHKNRYALAAMYLWQYSLIGRIDDAAQTKVTAIKPSSRFPFALQCQLTWSKNILEERQAPFQILFASMQSDMCLFIALAVHLENWIHLNGGVLPSEYLFVIGGDGNNPNSSKAAARDKLNKILRNPLFIAEFPGLHKEKTGTHSFRKTAATQARRNGCSEEDVGHRGRWKNRSGRRKIVRRSKL